jgi:hypothetical protein
MKGSDNESSLVTQIAEGEGGIARRPPPRYDLCPEQAESAMEGATRMTLTGDHTLVGWPNR